MSRTVSVIVSALSLLSEDQFFQPMLFLPHSVSL
jgi:hypothetical protein